MVNTIGKPTRWLTYIYLNKVVTAFTKYQGSLHLSTHNTCRVGYNHILTVYAVLLQRGLSEAENGTVLACSWGMAP